MATLFDKSNFAASCSFLTNRNPVMLFHFIYYTFNVYASFTIVKSALADCDATYSPHWTRS